MSFHVVRFESTPNPNAVKCILDRPISDRPRSFRSPEEADADPLANALFTTARATCLLMNGDWITVNKSPDDAWPAMKERISRVLAEPPEDNWPPTTGL